MALLTEDLVRQMSNHGTRGPVVVNRDDVLTPSARSYLLEHRVEVVYPQGETSSQRSEKGSKTGPKGSAAEAKYQTLFGASLQEKPEHMTHLVGNTLVFKDHPRIVFRGFVDLLEAEILLAQQSVAGALYPSLCAELEEVLHFVRRLIRFDVLGEAVGELRLCGYGASELREFSHYPERHFGQPHFMPGWKDDPAILAVNKVRTVVRQTELAAYKAFRDENGAVSRNDIILGLNRLSSLMWIMMIKLKAGKYPKESR